VVARKIKEITLENKYRQEDQAICYDRANKEPNKPFHKTALSKKSSLVKTAETRHAISMKFITQLSLISAFALSGLACSANSDPGAAATEIEAIKFDTAAMDTLLSQAVESGELIGVQALVFDEGEVVYRGVFGLGDRERGTALTEDSVYRVYSMTKPMTAALIMDLVEDGKLKLSDPASKYVPQLAQMKVASLDENGVPQFKDQNRPITIEDLMLHRAGLAYGIFGVGPIEEAYAKAELFNPKETIADQMDKLAALPLLGQPGEQWFYSYSIDVLGRVAEVATGQTLGEAFNARFFEPLGMTETGFLVSPEQKPRFVSNYMRQEDGNFVLAEDGQSSPFADPQNKFESGGGGLVSTTADWLKFAQLLLNEGKYNGVQILEPESIRLMMTDHTGPDFPYLLPWLGGETGAGQGYGASIQVTATQKQQIELGRYPGQFGWGGAARTNFWIDPENNAIGIIMLQFFSPVDPEIHDQFRALALAQTRNDGVNLKVE